MIDVAPVRRVWAVAFARTLLACTLLAGTLCACQQDGGPGDKPDAGLQPGSRVQLPPEEIPVVSPTAPCDSLSRQQCLGSTHCTLHWIKTSVYECRPDDGPCETGLSQNDKKGCIAKPGCLYKEPSCYCPFPGYGTTKVADTGAQGGACACGGGAPALCFQAGGPQPDAGAAGDGSRDAGGRDAAR
jgi:hypothetical protein